MRLKSAHIKHFKRFVDLTIQGVPADTKLVVLLGPNGCGKSSLFDAFQKRLKVEPLIGLGPDLESYYKRATSASVPPDDEVRLDFHGSYPTSQADLKKSLYVRSAYRHDPSFRNTAIQQQPGVLDRHAVRRLIDTDQTVQSNYQRIIWRVLRQVTVPGLSTDKIMADTIGDLQTSMEVVFRDIRLDALVTAQDTGTFTFTKGMSTNFLYENLSAGEKAAFDLLLDVVISRAAYDDTLYCVDEPDLHLSTRLQGTLLRELYGLVPDSSQLWLATHSIGMVRTAQQIRAEHPLDVAFLDMGFRPDGEPRDYDEPQLVEPADPDHSFWLRHYAVALDDMAGLLAPDCVVLCEGAAADDDPALDEACYNRVFAREFPRTRFISVGAASKVEKRMADLLPLLDRIVRGASIIRFRDRDALTPQEIELKRREGVRVMSAHRNLESMLLSDGNLSRLCDSVDQSDLFADLLKARDSAMARGSGDHADDDFKPSAQAVHQAARNLLGMPRPGETKQAFMRDVLAPLISPDSPEYANLKNDIFGD